MLDIRALVWDEVNIPHIARHTVTKDEVEQACRGDYIVWEADKGRFMLVGETSADRLISVVLHDKGEGRYYPVTARSASQKERRRYQRLKGGENTA
ncbi:MAG: hypothetical protein UV59_C0016G0044 [Candidatus Gottesmanbacteria bacterium GW2011_GWA1_43_11]|uniref:BrnT family toxin n=1 Tax=Candidatus Gottesmanbacteria bacterium GW2011_GWA1_43_11 TaxID=1618436 RepID=A0A0G1ENR5_9BACT|nr:MAG: hypothetical protein UV59_C0016G0044 [Candidatus Gottesmanbacteria bacterium GW2011_GWA1_43_11]